VRTRFGRRSDDRARRLLILCLEILRDDPVLPDRVSRERIASAGVLPRDTTARQIILQARAVDEHVDLVRTAPTRCKRAELGAINAVLRHLNSWSERGEV